MQNCKMVSFSFVSVVNDFKILEHNVKTPPHDDSQGIHFKILPRKAHNYGFVHETQNNMGIHPMCSALLSECRKTKPLIVIHELEGSP